MEKKEQYIPALNRRWLTPLYDPLLKWGMREDTFKRHLIEYSNLANDHKVLDLGCGTGTLTIQIKQHFPSIELIGLDGDATVLQIAGHKAEAAGISIQWKEGLATELPYPEASFDRVVSCLVIHHLTASNKVKAFKEVFRVLKPGGEFHLLDFGKPTSLIMKIISIPIARLEEAGDNIRGLLPEMLRCAGLSNASEVGRFKTLFGELVHYRSFHEDL
ncbi:MAG: methyltransferase type 11 [Chloroflexi bacterium HGW-Chloroflexi-8]|jgi:ubiquinone/menaquinone biosynthesis C-methylase UbiE|nr:MAG: methyltransferase type 11 [Chloroflexi bacterium HGW-Chloroflexi-8]